MKNKLRQIRDLQVLTAAKAVRRAWIDEQLNAEASGDTKRAAEAAVLVNACERRINALQRAGGVLKRLGAPFTALLH